MSLVSGEDKRMGVRVLNLSPSPGGAASGSESEYNQQCGERCDEATERSKKRMRVSLSLN